MRSRTWRRTTRLTSSQGSKSSTMAMVPLVPIACQPRPGGAIWMARLACSRVVEEVGLRRAESRIGRRVDGFADPCPHRRPILAPLPLSCAALRRESVRFAPASFACLPSIVMAGSLAAPSRTGFYVQQSVVDRLYALPPGKPSAASEIFGPGPWHALAWHNAAASCSPALASHRGMRHHEAAEAVGFTVHAGDHSCMRGDSCPQQRDAISNLTRAMSDGLFRVEFHSATAKAKAYRDFINEVRLQALAVEACPDRKWCRRNRRA
jgi:hypothetical protein